MKQNEERIHVCYALSDPYGTYAKFPGTSLCSLFENTASPVSAHILHDDTLTPENRERFLRLGEQYGQEILFYHVTELAKETWGRAMALFPEGLSSRRYTSANMYRLLLPALLPPEVDKAIYLDGDTVVHMDVAELWGESVTSGLAAVSDLELLHHYGKEGRESKEASYLYRGGSARLETVFNAGVLVFRLDLLRKGENLLLSGVKFLSEHRDCKYYDNDILIAFFGESYTHLPWYCNIRLNWDIAYGDGALVTGIYHYLGRNYRMDGQDPRHALFLSYYRKSPWCDERTLVKACRLAQDIAVAKTRERLREVQRIYRLCFRKQRVFVGLAEDEARLRRDFFLHGGEYYLPLAPGDTLRLPYSVDTHVYLFFWADYGAIRALMEKAGYEEYVHFADGRKLMPEQTEDLLTGELDWLWNL